MARTCKSRHITRQNKTVPPPVPSGKLSKLGAPVGILTTDYVLLPLPPVSYLFDNQSSCMAGHGREEVPMGYPRGLLCEFACRRPTLIWYTHDTNLYRYNLQTIAELEVATENQKTQKSPAIQKLSDFQIDCNLCILLDRVL